MADKKESSLLEQRYRYIGFDVYPTKTQKFWKSEEEKKSHLEKVKEQKGLTTLEKRDHSLLFVSVFNKTDKLILTISSALILVSLFIPWVAISGADFKIKLSPLALLPKLSVAFNFLSLGGNFILIEGVLLILSIIFSALVGILCLINLFKQKQAAEAGFSKLKRYLLLSYVPLVINLVFLFLPLAGISTPFYAFLGVEQLSVTFGLINLINILQIGFWLSLMGLIVNCAMASNL